MTQPSVEHATVYSDFPKRMVIYKKNNIRKMSVKAAKYGSLADGDLMVTWKLAWTSAGLNSEASCQMNAILSFRFLHFVERLAFSAEILSARHAVLFWSGRLTTGRLTSVQGHT